MKKNVMKKSASSTITSSQVRALTSAQKDQLVHQYEPLISKITHQFTSRLPVSWPVVKSMAYEGFSLAMKNYDETKSKMTFAQYAGFAIRNAIYNGLDNELRVVKLSKYAQKKSQDRGESLFNSVSLDGKWGDERDDESSASSREMRLGAVERPDFSDGDVFEYLYNRVDEKWGKRDADIFYKTFGLKGEDIWKGKDIAARLGVSEGLISQRVKKMVSWIRKDDDLMEMMSKLL